MAQEMNDDLIDLGIDKISKFSNKEDYKMVKAICKNEDLMNRLIKNGLFLNYCKFKIEKYMRPIKPVQCFNCQKFGHYSSACDQISSTCVKCSGKHKLSECKSSIISWGNCKQQHTSSYGGCKVSQKHIKEKTDLINKKNGNLSNTKQYSQIVKVSSTNDIINSNLLNQTIENLTSRIENMETNIINKVSEKFNEYKIEQEEIIIKKIDEFSKFQDAEVKKKFEEFSNNINDRLKKF